MKKLFCLVVLMMFIGCVNDSTNTVPEQKMGRFAVQKIDTSSSTAKRSISEMNGGTINASTDSFFILKNVGTADIENIKIYSLYAKSGYTPSDSSPDTDFITETGEINSTNFETAEAAFTINPGTLNVIEPYSEVSTIPLIKISISHGENANGIGLADLLPQGTNKTYIVITGTSAGVKLQENIEFSTLVNVASWEILYDTDTETGVKASFDRDVSAYIIPVNGTIVYLRNIGNVSLDYATNVVYAEYMNTAVSLITGYKTVSSEQSVTLTEFKVEETTQNYWFFFIDTKGYSYDFKNINTSKNQFLGIFIKQNK